MNAWRGSAVLVAGLVAAATLLPAASAVTSKQSFDGNLCKAVSQGELHALGITAPCGWSKVVHVESTPLGSVRVVTYVAHWGHSLAHSMSIGAVYVHGAAAAVAYARNYFRQQVLANGTPFRSKPLATESGDTYACPNPPTDDCTKGEIMALVGRYGVTIALNYGPTKSTAADDPQNPSVDVHNDLAQEDAIKGDFIAAANDVIAAL